MQKVAPLGPVYQAGTLSGNPVAVAAGAASLEEVLRPGFFESLERSGGRFERGVRGTIDRLGVPVTFVRVGSSFWFVFQEPPAPRAFDEIRKEGAPRYARFHRALLERGVYFAPSGYEVGFISSAHTPEQLDETVAAVGEALALVHETDPGRTPR